MDRSTENLLTQIRQGKVPSILLVHGDDFLTHEACKAVVDLLAPPEERVFNLERFNGQTVSWNQIEASLRTPSLFPGRKTVWVENAPDFQTQERKADLVQRALELWGEGEKEKAAGLLLGLMRLAGWTEKKREKTQLPLSPSQLTEIFGARGKEAEKESQELFAFSRTLAPSLDQHAGEESGLMEILDQGLPSWAVLLVVASHVDRRTALYHRFRERGTVLDLELEREKSGKPSREMLGAFLDHKVREAGKAIEPRAREAILERAGDELWALHQELEKLLLYAGEEPRIRTEHVERVCLHLSDDWVFDLTRAIAERDAVRALGHLQNLLAQGEAPLKLLAIVAKEVRRLLLARQLLEGDLSGHWRSRMTFAEFQKVVQQRQPLLTRNPYGEYMTLQRAEPFTTAELVGYLERIYQTDQRLKSSGAATRITMERLIVDLCRARNRRSPQNEQQA